MIGCLDSGTGPGETSLLQHWRWIRDLKALLISLPTERIAICQRCCVASTDDNWLSLVLFEQADLVT